MKMFQEHRRDLGGRNALIDESKQDSPSKTLKLDLVGSSLVSSLKRISSRERTRKIVTNDKPATNSFFPRSITAFDKVRPCNLSCDGPRKRKWKLQARATSGFIFPHTSYRTIGPSIFLRVGPLYCQMKLRNIFWNSDRVDLPSLDYRHYDH
ncbi:hypothetical protein RIR_jg11655.t1 [Rhizophagus irregularis DAOM 181602=DAOM 197198]|nr:hypothetical protein RIR_jg11655.t1 [Rhizophagus irregularis DAOM 181602=DAOM 197198]